MPRTAFRMLEGRNCVTRRIPQGFVAHGLENVTNTGIVHYADCLMVIRIKLCAHLGAWPLTGILQDWLGMN